MKKYKKFPISETLDDRLKKEVRESGISGNTIVILALDEFLSKKEKGRKNRYGNTPLGEAITEYIK